MGMDKHAMASNVGTALYSANMTILYGNVRKGKLSSLLIRALHRTPTAQSKVQPRTLLRIIFLGAANKKENIKLM